MLATRRHVEDRIREQWDAFRRRRRDRLAQHGRFGTDAAEKVAENILEDLFTLVLDWPLAQVDYQVDFADMVLTRLGIKHLVVEVKRPGKLAWHRAAVDAALEQALRYAHEQKVQRIAVSDGVMLYAADRVDGGLRDRIFVDLDADEPPVDLWWLSMHGVYRPRTVGGGALRLLPEAPVVECVVPAGDLGLLHPKYHLPSRCFAYVGDPSDPATWKLPYLEADGAVSGRLPGAIRAIVANYRGASVTIPEEAVPDVLVRLGRAAERAGKLPGPGRRSAATYEQLAEVLEQLGRLDEVTDR